MKCTSNMRSPILYSLGRIKYMREALKRKETVSEKVELTYVIENEIINALHNQVPVEKYPAMLYDMEAELDNIERRLIAMELCLVSQQPTSTKRGNIKSHFYNLRKELKK